MNFKTDIRIRDRVNMLLRRRGGGDERRSTPRKGGGAPPVRIEGPKVESNVHIKKIHAKSGEVVETRDGHNIFTDYGRDWLSHLIAYSAISPSETTFRDDRIRYMAVGIGGTSQLLSYTTIEPTHAEWQGYAGNWGSVVPAPSLPGQEDTDPTVLGLEWPVQVTSGAYYDDVYAPSSFPGVGIVRFTSVLGVNEASFGSFTSVPISEVGLFTKRVDTDLGGAPTPPLVWPAETYTEKAMVAYNTFDTLSKTPAFTLQFDWEIRLS